MMQASYNSILLLVLQAVATDAECPRHSESGGGGGGGGWGGGGGGGGEGEGGKGVDNGKLPKHSPV